MFFLILNQFSLAQLSFTCTFLNEIFFFLFSFLCCLPFLYQHFSESKFKPQVINTQKIDHRKDSSKSEGRTNKGN